MANRPGRPRTRLNMNRPATLPTVPTGPQVPSIEDSLQVWLGQNLTESPTTPILEANCPCCNRPNCEPFERLAHAVRKVEGDARLAAEIGQSLLHKHETHVLECSQVKAALEEQIEQSNEKIRQLEQLLVDADAAKQELEAQKSKSVREWQKTQKTLQETAADLEAANARCTQLADELRKNSMEVDKLRIFKFMVRQADIREEALRAKLEDTKHELAISRKTELTIESKHKKLKVRHESICSAYEKLKLDQKEMGLTGEKHMNLAWLKESNEKLRKEMLKLTSSLSPASWSDTSSTGQNHQGQLVTLIKELVSANNKLKSELLDCCDLLAESRSEIAVLQSRVERQESLEDQESLPSEKENNDHRDQALLSTSAPQTLNNACTPAHDHTRLGVSDLTRHERGATLPTRDGPLRTHLMKPSPTSSTSMPTSTRPDTTPNVVHRHYHYYVRKSPERQDNGKHSTVLADDTTDSTNSKGESGCHRNDTPPDNTVTKSFRSVSTQISALADGSLAVDPDDTRSPFQMLCDHVIQLLQRLRATDIRALNRRLRRVFDILELSAMSNSIIDNILTDVGALKTRFLWVEEQVAKELPDGPLVAFFALVQVSQDMLVEIGELRATMNDLQLEYVKKVEENDMRAEKEALLKHEHRLTSHKEQPASSGALAWLTSMFLRPSGQAEDGQLPQSSTMSPHGTGHATTETTRSTEKPSPLHTHSLRRQRSDLERQGPSSSLPRPTLSSSEKRTGPAVSYPTQSASSSTSQPRPIPYPTLRASRSAGTSTRRNPSSQPPLLDHAVVRKKKSHALGLAVPIGDNNLSKSQGVDVDWKVGNTLSTTSWLGNK